MSLAQELKNITDDRLDAAVQDLNHESRFPQSAVKETLRRASEYPAFELLIHVFKRIGRERGENSKELARCEGMKIIFEALISIAEGEQAHDLFTGASVDESETNRTVERLTEICRLRNQMEIKLRLLAFTFVSYSSLHDTNAATAKERILAIIDSTKRGQCSNLTAWQVMETRYMWSDLTRLIKKEWRLFEPLFGDQSQFQSHCDIINDRPDAHAKPIDDADLAMHRRSIKWLEDKILTML